MMLLEVIVTPDTSDEVTATAVALGKAQGKHVIVVGDGAGFYTSRILAPYINEAAWAISEGVPVEVVDEALMDWGFPVGPVTLLDEVGIDVAPRSRRSSKRPSGPAWPRRHRRAADRGRAPRPQVGQGVLSLRQAHPRAPRSLSTRASTGSSRSRRAPRGRPRSAGGADRLDDGQRGRPLPEEDLRSPRDGASALCLGSASRPSPAGPSATWTRWARPTSSTACAPSRRRTASASRRPRCWLTWRAEVRASSRRNHTPLPHGSTHGAPYLARHRDRGSRAHRR